MTFDLTVGEILAVLALLLSVYATVQTVRFNSRQRSLIESQERLNQRLLLREEGQARADLQADVSASFIRLGKGSCRLKVFNKGKAVARNVRIAFPEGDSLFIRSDVDSKFPMELLEPYQAVELMAAPYFGSKGKYAITVTWDDDFQESNEKTLYLTL
jgi:hypothetical protein